MSTFKTGVEQFVKAYLRTHGVGTLSKIYVQKALVLVNTKLTNPCCTSDTATIDLLTRKPNMFVSTVESLLNIITKNGNKQSLLRTKALLEARLNCCPIT